MKFAKSLQRNQVPEWSQSYLDYKGLKKIIKELVQQHQNGSVVEAELAPFYYSLDRNIESVDSFYDRKYSEYCRRLRHAVERINTYSNLKDIPEDELEDIVDVLLSLRSQLRKLQWFAEVNKRGFVKILKKLDKKLKVNTQTKVLSSKVFILGFANGNSTDDRLAVVNRYLSNIAPHTHDNGSVASNGSGNGPLNTGNPSTTDQIIAELERPVLQRHSSSTSTSSLPESAFAEFKMAVANDDVESLEKIENVPQKALLSGLSKAIACNSRACIKYLLENIDTLDGVAELNDRNVFHRLIISRGRSVNHCTKSDITETASPASLAADTPAIQQRVDSHYINPAELPTKLSHALGSDGVLARDEVDMLRYVLDHLKSNQHDSLMSRDQYLRTPLHYAAHYGLKNVTELLIDRMNSWNIWKVADCQWNDSDGMNPLQLAVSGNHPKTTKALLAADPGVVNQWIRESNGQLLHVAARLNSALLIETLLSNQRTGIDINGKDEHDETPLFVASKLDNVNAVEYLVKHGADMELSENTYGWTPVIVAAVDGYEKVAKILIDAGCNIDKTDESGWTAMEHACLRGHVDLAKILTPKHAPWITSTDGTPPPMMLDDLSTVTMSKDEAAGRETAKDGSGVKNGATVEGSKNGSTKTSTSRNGSVAPVTSIKSGKSLINNDNMSQEAVLTFGHRYLDRTMILVTLGGTDARDSSNPVSLDQVPYSKAHSTQLDTALSLVVSSSCVGEPLVYDLPIPDNGHATEPIAFYLDQNEDVDNVKIYFDLVPTYSGNQKRKVGRAVALLGSISRLLGTQTRSLRQTINIPFVGSESLEVLGSINFTVLVVTPFSHSKMGIEKNSTYWKSLITTRVIGHRGLGKNSTSKNSLQLGENTLESFIQAANLGASYVEFDVQLTKDKVPVIYHDFLVNESGIDVPMHELTLEQFLDLSRPKMRTPKLKPHSPPMRPVTRSPDVRHRSMSMVDEGDEEYDAMTEQLKLTRDFKLKGYKGNFRGHSIQSPFTTLQEVFKTLPKTVGFNIECKFPMLDESEKEDMQAIAFEMNIWVDTVLKCVYDNADGRDIIFSSFHPDICLMLSLKQPSIPVLFLTDSGTQPMCDIRATSLQEAVRFATRWDLLGIVSECTPLILCPRLVNVVKESGLVCMSYGSDNNDPNNARLQMKNGVDAVIVDSVLAVRKGLQGG